MSKPRLGSGQRFARLERRLERRGARSPGGLAAYIGRKKYGKKRFQELSAAGRRHHPKGCQCGMHQGQKRHPPGCDCPFHGGHR